MDEKDIIKVKNITEDDIKNIIKDQLSVSEVNDSDRLVDDLFADSLDIVELLLRFEDEYGVEIQEGELPGNCQVKEIVDLVLSKVND